MKAVRVVKVGGAALAEPDWLEGFAALLSQAAPCIVVHGGGPDLSALSVRLGVEPEWVGGRRVTTPEALDLATMVLSGRVNKRIVAALLAAGVDALGVSGVDAGLLRAEPLDGGRLGRVGRIVSVRAELLGRLLESGLAPVVSPLSLGADGQALNVNADEAAAAIAAAVGAAELLFITDVPAVHDGRSDRRTLGAAEAAALVRSGTAKDGMAVKLEAAVAACGTGGIRVRVGSLEMLTDAAAGTLLELEVAA